MASFSRSFFGRIATGRVEVVGMVSSPHLIPCLTFLIVSRRIQPISVKSRDKSCHPIHRGALFACWRGATA